MAPQVLRLVLSPLCSVMSLATKGRKDTQGVPPESLSGQFEEVKQVCVYQSFLTVGAGTIAVKLTGVEMGGEF